MLGLNHSARCFRARRASSSRGNRGCGRHQTVHTMLFSQSNTLSRIVSTNPGLQSEKSLPVLHRYDVPSHGQSKMRQVNSYLLSLCLLVAEYVLQQRPDATASISRDRSVSMEEVPTLSRSALNALARFLSDEIQQPLQDAPEEPLGAGSSFTPLFGLHVAAVLPV